jgi:Kelch motif
MGGFIGTDLFQFGGFGTSFRVGSNRAAYQSTVTGLWTQVDPLPNPKGISHMGTVIVGNKVYACGGFVGGLGGGFVATNECYVYTHKNPSGSQWATLPSLPGIRAGGGLMYDTVRNSLIFATGADEKRFSNVDHYDVWELALDDIAAGWVSIVPLPYRANHVGATTVDYQGIEKHFVVGGQHGSQEFVGNYDLAYEFNFVTNAWTQIANIPLPTGHTSSSTIPYKTCGFFIMGGSNNCDCRTSAIYYYDIGTNTWTRIGDLPKAGNTPVCSILGDWLYCIIRQTTFRRKLS